MEGVIRGYRPQVDWGGEGGSATIMVGRQKVHVGTAGWRKRCLFILLAALLLLSVINLLLTIWILRKINFNAEGAGMLHVKVGGVELDGIARIDHEMRTREIKARPNESLDISGYYNISAGTILDNGSYSALLLLDSEGVKGISKSFTIKDNKGNLIFKAEDGKTEVGSNFYTVKGDGGADLLYSLQTPRVLGDEVHEFRLESQTRSVKASAANLLRVVARDGDVSSTALKDISLRTKKGKFRFESPNVFFPRIPQYEEETDGEMKANSGITEKPLYKQETQIVQSIVEGPTSEPFLEDDTVGAYQVCVCPSGRLFLSANDECHFDDDICR